MLVKSFLASCLTISLGCFSKSLRLFKENPFNVVFSCYMIYGATTQNKNIRESRASGSMILGKLTSQGWMFRFASWKMFLVLGQMFESSSGCLAYSLNWIKTKSPMKKFCEKQHIIYMSFTTLHMLMKERPQ